MTDTTHAGRPDPHPLPAATVFDPEAVAGGPGGTVVLLLVSTPDREWAAEVAVELGARWAQGGRRIVLADLSFEQPVLHDHLGMPNLEGVVDIFLYGASLARSAQRVPGRGFHLITAGTYDPDADALFRHPRWSKLVTGFRDADASLLLFLPAETADVEALSQWASEAIVLGRPTDRSFLRRLDEEVPVRAVLVPEGESEPEAVEAAAPVAVTSTLVSADDEALILPPTPAHERERQGRGVPVLFWLLVAVALMAALGYLAARVRPDLLPWVPSGTRADSLAAADVVPLPVPPTPVGEPLPYSVQVKAFASLAAARAEVAAERGRVAGTQFFISPEEDGGILYYKILAGLLPDTVLATRLRERLVSAGAVDPEDAVGAWSLIQFTPLTFDLGEFPSPEAASAVADSLLAREIPAYSVAVPYSDGSERWRLYVGAYRDSAAAGAMRDAISAAGMTPRLVPRRGGQREATESE